MRSTCFRVAAWTTAFCLVSIVAAAQGGKADVTGTWVFTVATSAGSGIPTITLKQDGEKLTGHYSGQLGEADLTGSVSGQSITFSFNVQLEGTPLRCTYAGSIENADSLKGTVDIAGLAAGTFTAKRQ